MLLAAATDSAFKGIRIMEPMFDLGGYEWMLWQGAWMTLTVGLTAMGVAMALGLVGAWGRLSKLRLVRGAASTYTTVVRGVPELVMILLVYYGAPTLIQDVAGAMGFDIQVDLNKFVAGAATIGFIYGAFATEVFRGAFMAVPKGQIEACKAHGMGRWLTFRRVLLPQMMRYALPGLGNVWMVLIKATALVSVIQLHDLLFNANLAGRATRKPFTLLFAASLIYLAITVISMWMQNKAERWAQKGVRKS